MNLLATKFEAYLKKLYYLINKEEVKPQYEGEPVSWKHVIYAFRCLRGLKYNTKSEYQTLYSYLELVKSWRNDESHISPTASEEEVIGAINIIITMYCFATGSNITELESAGYDIPSTVTLTPILPYSRIGEEDESAPSFNSRIAASSPEE